MSILVPNDTVGQPDQEANRILAAIGLPRLLSLVIRVLVHGLITYTT